MKILYVCDTRLYNFNSKEIKYLFKYWIYSLHDLLINSESRNIKIWLVCINLIDYIDIIKFTDPFNYENVKNGIESIAPYFQKNNEDLVNDKETTIDPLFSFLKTSKNISKIKECNKIIILSSNIYIWANNISTMKLIGDAFRSCSSEFYLFNVQNSLTDSVAKMQQLDSNLLEYPNFFFKNIELNKISILQISKEILAIKFDVSFTLKLKNETLLKCQGRPIITELDHLAFAGLRNFIVEFDVRARALKDGISQHMIYGIPIFLSSDFSYKQNLVSMSSLAKELYENDQVLILRSNINPIDLKTHEQQVRFLWVATPMIKDETPTNLCLHGLSTQETYSLNIEESYTCDTITNEKTEDSKLKDIMNFLILVDDFNPYHYSNERFDYSFKFSRNSLTHLIAKDNVSKNMKKRLTLLKSITCDNDSSTNQEKRKLLKNKDNSFQTNNNLKRKKEIPDPRSLLLANMNKAFQKNII
ncbi:conserved Plasmodium protein, unknown function [Plasmodium chabaudi chabaudi]|uniref:Uncharacterized protein n=1 Tax=Plasmodium chabaudi chabaudi TaxID=31271 RepID=A0A4V0KCD3_PLACU|nr:conserved Plasmodium protein, unknown function [Plasmodium chabaudi chabaudi]VTZ70616.1 conserved Plasmodium protein, unknown function [Plasmodium chabaudi chabaudi]|eukprot:XP_016654756.1 conserved Plasmodium protein, unknown function [Plasmodium chabaudi chabaudi]